MAKMVKIGGVDDLRPGERMFVDFENATLAVFNVDGAYYCIEDVCTHDGGPLAEGPLDGFAIVCPRHGAMFDIRDGAVLAMPAVVPVPTYQVKVEDGEIFVESPDG
jgi:3-phenylpropionate/trans-cinnamate dioxygenase ferredoxin component